jgi:PKD repeat protein
VNSNTQHNKIKQKASKMLQHIFPFITPVISIVPVKTSGKNNHHLINFFNDSDIYPSTIINLFMREAYSFFLLAGVALFLCSSNLFAANANLTWDASTSTNVGGYKVSYGQISGSYSSTIDVGNATTYSATGLQEGTKYYFAVKAYDLAKTTESVYSNEVNLTVPVATAITANFTVSVTSGVQGMSVAFTPNTTGAVTSWQWSFTGSYTPSVTNSTAQVVTVTYPTPGTYSVSLTASGASGSATKTSTNLITVTALPPVANFSSSVTSGIAPVSVNFTDTSTGDIASRSWNFGDGSTSTIQNPAHTYSVAGTYTVSLTVAGAGGSTIKTNNGFISVASPPPVPAPVSETSKNGLVAAYGFEEVSGATVADASGNGNNGTISNAVRITTGHSGNALQFNGTNAWVTVNDSASLDLSTGMTIEAWVYPQSLTTGGGNTIISKEQSGGIVYTLYANGNKNVPLSSYDNGGYHVIFGSNQLLVNKWTHLVVTYDGQYQRLYVNGSQVAVQAQNTLIQPSTGMLRIGGNSIWGEYFKGYIDEVRIYKRALTVAEVNYNLTTAVSVSNPVKFVMGDKTLEPWVDYKQQGIAEAFQTTPQKTGVVTTVQVYLDASSTATELVAGIYKNTNGHPGALVAQGKLSTLKPGAWNLVPIPVASVTAAQPYWVAILGSKGQIGFLDRIGSGTGLMEASTSSTLTTLPSTWAGTAYQINSAMSVFGLGY